MLQDIWSCSISIRKHITVFIKLNSSEGCEFNRSEVLNLLEISVFVSVRRNSGLSGAKLYGLKFAFILNMYISCSGFGGLGVVCWPVVPKFMGANPAKAIRFLSAKKSSARLPLEGK